ncbi:MAG: NAD(+)/NADH kinase [Planctomycetota bacterium]
MSRLRILVVGKRTTLERWDERCLEHLEDIGIMDRSHLEAEHAQHHRSLARVHEQLAACQVHERQIDVLTHADARQADIIVTVGGDGTVLATHTHLSDTPIIAVNSDPNRSVGHYTRCRPDGVYDLVQAWIGGHAREELCHRLLLEIIDVRTGQRLNGRGDNVLNDCLFTNENPAAMTRYILSTAAGRETQWSSGVWISTAAGSTGAIASAGALPVEPGTPALLYLVREPFFGRGGFDDLTGRQLPPTGLELTPTIPGLSCYIDGAHLRRRIKPGTCVRFSADAPPLRLLTPA